jgi:hypothetical protein
MDPYPAGVGQDPVEERHVYSSEEIYHKLGKLEGLLLSLGENFKTSQGAMISLTRRLDAIEGRQRELDIGQSNHITRDATKREDRMVSWNVAAFLVGTVAVPLFAIYIVWQGGKAQEKMIDESAQYRSLIRDRSEMLRKLHLDANELKKDEAGEKQ